MENNRICPVCYNVFKPSYNNQIYDDKKCRYIAYKRKKKLERVTKGCCPQCGKEHDYPMGSYKAKTSYCSSCQKYFKQKYLEKKEGNRK